MFSWLIIYKRQLSFIYLQRNSNLHKLYGAVLSLFAGLVILTPLVGCKESLNYIETDFDGADAGDMCINTFKPIAVVFNVYFWLIIFGIFAIKKVNKKGNTVIFPAMC